MNSRRRATDGRYKDVAYFNGGLFQEIHDIDLKSDELPLLVDAARQDWSRVRPAIFGTLFEASMDQDLRHAQGAHFTSEADIQKVVLPTIREHAKELSDAVRDAYGFGRDEDGLQALYELNEEIADRIKDGIRVTGPGIPPSVPDPDSLVSDDCVGARRL